MQHLVETNNESINGIFTLTQRLKLVFGYVNSMVYIIPKAIIFLIYGFLAQSIVYLYIYPHFVFISIYIYI